MSPVLNSIVLQRRFAILAAIAALRSSINPTRTRLDLATRSFLDTPHFTNAVGFEWSDPELFGISPVCGIHRVDVMGLVTSLALSKLAGPRLEAIHAKHALTRYASGSILTSWRARRGDILGVPWWLSPELGAKPHEQLEEIAA